MNLYNNNTKITSSTSTVTNESTLKTRQQKYTDNTSYSSANSNDETYSKTRSNQASSTKLVNSNASSSNENGNSSNSSGSSRLKKIKGLVNNEYCSYCDEGGNLLNCDRCPVSFHLLCHEPPLDYDQIPKGDFLCNKCKSKAKLLHNEHSDIKLELLPISNETKLVEFISDESDTALETLIKISKALNPRQMTLSANLNIKLDVDIPGLNKSRWNKDCKIFNNNYCSRSSFNGLAGIDTDATNNHDSNQQVFNFADNNQTDSIVNGAGSNDVLMTSRLRHLSNSANRTTNRTDSNSNGQSKIKICFLCRKLIKLDKLAKCDFCPLTYHLDCLNPPLCVVPSRDKLWMCPSHIEHYLEHYLQRYSNRFSERVKLWKKFSINSTDFTDIINQFVDKCKTYDLNQIKQVRNGETSSFGTGSKRPIHKCQIPFSVRHLYSSISNSSENEDDDFLLDKNDENEDDQIKTMELDIDLDKNQLNLEAAEALLLLSESNNLKEECHTISPRSNHVLQIPSLNKFSSKSIKPRALLQLLQIEDKIEITSLSQLKSQISQMPLFSITNRSITIGFGDKVDICLKSVKSTQTKECSKISEKHACIYYDEKANIYELINYSEHGTIVNNCLYGINISNRDESVNRHASLTNSLASNNNSNNLKNKSKCECYRHRLKSKRFLNECEGEESSAQLSHGSVLIFGCFKFLFIVVDYDFVKFNLERKLVSEKLTSSQSLNRLKYNPMLNGNSTMGKTVKRLNNGKKNGMYDNRRNFLSLIYSSSLLSTTSNVACQPSNKTNSNKKTTSTKSNGKSKNTTKKDEQDELLSKVFNNENKKYLLI